MGIGLDESDNLVSIIFQNYTELSCRYFVVASTTNPCFPFLFSSQGVLTHTSSLDSDRISLICANCGVATKDEDEGGEENNAGNDYVDSNSEGDQFRRTFSN